MLLSLPMRQCMLCKQNLNKSYVFKQNRRGAFEQLKRNVCLGKERYGGKETDRQADRQTERKRELVVSNINKRHPVFLCGFFFFFFFFKFPSHPNPLLSRSHLSFLYLFPSHHNPLLPSPTPLLPLSPLPPSPIPSPSPFPSPSARLPC